MQTVSVNAGKSNVDIEINLVCKVIARARVVTVLFPKFSSEFKFPGYLELQFRSSSSYGMHQLSYTYWE